mmetsp:Transcript_82968/g.256539  ORF Transcript_82968/g.256539 Transcript_82968/m.256539 type:complete len:379 (-) Transcript_82968:100-1236(-)
MATSASSAQAARDGENCGGARASGPRIASPGDRHGEQGTSSWAARRPEDEDAAPCSAGLSLGLGACGCRVKVRFWGLATSATVVRNRLRGLSSSEAPSCCPLGAACWLAASSATRRGESAVRGTSSFLAAASARAPPCSVRRYLLGPPSSMRPRFRSRKAAARCGPLHRGRRPWSFATPRSISGHARALPGASPAYRPRATSTHHCGLPMARAAEEAAERRHFAASDLRPAAWTRGGRAGPTGPLPPRGPAGPGGVEGAAATASTPPPRGAAGCCGAGSAVLATACCRGRTPEPWDLRSFKGVPAEAGMLLGPPWTVGLSRARWKRRRHARSQAASSNSPGPSAAAAADSWTCSKRPDTTFPTPSRPAASWADRSGSG